MYRHIQPPAHLFTVPTVTYVIEGQQEDSFLLLWGSISPSGEEFFTLSPASLVFLYLLDFSHLKKKKKKRAHIREVNLASALFFCLLLELCPLSISKELSKLGALWFLSYPSLLKLLQLDFKKLLHPLLSGLCLHHSTEPVPAQAFGDGPVVKPNG